MNTTHPLHRYLSRYPAIAVLSYVLLVAASALAIGANLLDLYDQYTSFTAASDMLQHIEEKKSTLAATPADASLSDSPFLEGRTLTVAGAALQQRLASAVTKLGGNVQSLQVDLSGTQSQDGIISLIASFELNQPALQELLYELESGKPFLFIDQLVVQAPNTGAVTPEARLRILLTLSGRWLG